MTAVADSAEALLQFLYWAPIGLIQTTLDGRVELMNPRSAQLLMPIAPSSDLANLFDVLDPVVSLRDLVASHEAETGVICEALRFDVAPHAKNQPRRVYAISMMKVDHDRLMMVLDDLTTESRREEAASADRLWRAARVDRPTQMPNRLAMTEWITSTLDLPPEARLRRAILLVRCERLDEIAENVGEDVRLRVVDLMARRLRSVLRPRELLEGAVEVDQVAARTGDDEFVVLLQHLAHVSDATRVAQRIVDTLREPYRVDTHVLYSAVNVGVVAGVFDSLDAEETLRDAGLAVREAKRSGGSRWIEFDPAMHERAVERGKVEGDLRRAIGADELFVVYQPIVDLQTGGDTAQLAGVEALVRWRHPTRGVVPPVEFITVAEEIGLISEVGRFVLNRACRDFAHWSQRFGAASPRLLAVNLSRAQLGDARLVTDVTEALAACDVAADRLQLEVTESLAAQDDGVRMQLHRLKALGITVALDDFGTGYSSLSSLHLLPVDTVKIDRSFVMLADSSPQHRVLIEATIQVAQSLRMKTVAEGIETAGQQEIVRSLGCDKGQGYLYSRPLNGADIEAWIIERQRTATPELVR